MIPLFHSHILAGSKDVFCVNYIGIYHDGKEVHLFSGSMMGSLAPAPKEDNSFGWAPVFIPDGYDKTYAEFTDEERGPFAMRKKALEKLHEFLVSAGKKV